MSILLKQRWKWNLIPVFLIVVALMIVATNATATTSSNELVLQKTAELSAIPSTAAHHYPRVDTNEATLIDSTMARGPDDIATVHGHGILCQARLPMIAVAENDVEKTATLMILTSEKNMRRALTDEKIALAGSEVESALCEDTDTAGISGSGYSFDMAGGIVRGFDSAYCLSTSVAAIESANYAESRHSDATSYLASAEAAETFRVFTVIKAIS